MRGVITLKRNLKIVGTISEAIAESNGIPQYANKDILQSVKLDIHTNKHANDFFSIDSYHSTLINIDKVIEKPYYVEYDSKKNSLKYYGKTDQYVCIIVKLDKKAIYVSTFYPQSKAKIDKLKKCIKVKSNSP